MHASPFFVLDPARRLRSRFGSCLGVILLALSLDSAAAFDLQGHRGARGLAPENTLAGFEQALALGVSTLELDVVISADGVPVITHDPVLNPDITRDAAGRWLQERNQPIHALTVQELQTWDVGRINPASRYARDFAEQVPRDGERIPTLSSLFERVRQLGADGVRFNIETKLQPGSAVPAATPEAFVRAIVEVVRAHGMERRVSLQSFDWRTLQIAQQLAPAIPTAYLTAQLPRFDTVSSGEWTLGLRREAFESTPDQVASAGGKIWSPHHSNLSQAVLRRARELRLRVIPWTVNEIADMERLMDWGVDGIITDRPDRLRAVMQQRGMALPAATVPLTPLRSVQILDR
ncbi:glycerophosphodiester phosphodiesterase [Hydrogenophaga sp.]|uniref:glycerophosphodiester phosphodiesterase n=1 Tax=Hydrogenophaga sp. TaxID=1904254 RepID=UPI00262B2A45|nr:glycerophosphodiester phosphodiesterase [Hydrogenophaga sp.]MDM7948078.1 glycerophosphodiester phosphodiesterase [Hydrogenophaga sp.]